jgi:hypothetical protein
MKRWLLITFSVSLFTLGLLGAGLLAALGPDFVLGRYPHAMTKSLNLYPPLGGLLAQDSAYETSDPVDTVAAWYARRYHLPLDPDRHLQGACVRLAKANELPVFRQSVVVSLCRIAGATQIYFSQLLYLSL